MVDTGRNYFPKEDLMRMLDAMSQNKMNYFHWHITDSASFPMYSNRRPEMAYYGAYSARKIYYPEDITEIVQYAKVSVAGKHVVKILGWYSKSCIMNTMLRGWKYGFISYKLKIDESLLQAYILVLS